MSGIRAPPSWSDRDNLGHDIHAMVVLRHFRSDELMGFRTADLALHVILPSGELAPMDRRAPAQVRQREGGLPVAGIGRADEVEKRFILRNRQELAAALHPARRCEVEAEAADFRNKWLRHLVALLNYATGKCPEWQ